MVRGGDQVKVLAPHAEGVERSWSDQGVDVETFRYAPEAWELLGYSRSLERDETPRFGAMAVTPLYLAAARTCLQREVRTGDYDLVQAHWVVPNGLLLPSIADRVATAVGLHGSDVFMAERRGISTWTKNALRSVDALTGCSPELVDRVCAVGFPAERSRVIPYGVNIEEFCPPVNDPSTQGVSHSGDARQWRQELKIPLEATVLLSVGRMVSKKGYQHLVPALAKLLAEVEDLHVIFAGGGDLLEDLQAATAQFADRVHFPGIVYRDRLPALYRASDLFVLPAVHDAKGNVDGLPNVILEAMATGLPVVASGISGIPLAIDDGDNGRLVAEADPEALVEALVQVASNRELRQKMGQRSRQRAVEGHTWDAIAGRYRQAYQMAIDRFRVRQGSRS